MYKSGPKKSAGVTVIAGRVHCQFLRLKLFTSVNYNDLYSSSSIARAIKSRRKRYAGHVARMGERRGLFRILVGKLEGKRSLGRPIHRWEDNMMTNLQEMGCEAWTGSSWLRIGTGDGYV